MELRINYLNALGVIEYTSQQNGDFWRLVFATGRATEKSQYALNGSEIFSNIFQSPGHFVHEFYGKCLISLEVMRFLNGKL